MPWILNICSSFIFQKKGVSTAHCSQCNTIEFEMAVEWIAAEERLDNASKRLTKVLYSSIFLLCCSAKF
jgi:hypothetical protein